MYVCMYTCMYVCMYDCINRLLGQLGMSVYVRSVVWRRCIVLLVHQFVSNKWKRAFEMCVSLKVFFHVIVCQSLDDGFLDRPLNDAILDIRYAAAGRQVRILPSFVILF